MRLRLRLFARFWSFELFRLRKDIEDRVIDGKYLDFAETPIERGQMEPRIRQVVLVSWSPSCRDHKPIPYALSRSDSRVGRQIDRRATALTLALHARRRGLTPQRLHA